MRSLPDIERVNTATSAGSAVRAVVKSCNSVAASYESNSNIQHEGDRSDSIYIVKSGWVFSYRVLADGQRQILYLHKPGDIAGFPGLCSEHALCSIRSLGDCVLYPIPKTVFTSSTFLTPPIASYFMRKSAEMQSVLMRTLMAVSRMGARDRIIWLLLMMHDRIGGGPGREEIELPLNQTEIGDLVGLTNVSVSKNLCQLSAEGMIERRGSVIHLRKRMEMQRLVGYEPVDFTWDILVSSNDHSRTGTDEKPVREAETIGSSSGSQTSVRALDRVTDN